MRAISISEEFKTICPHIRLGCISCQVTISENPNTINSYLQPLIEQLHSNIDLESIKASGPIFSSREAYKALGKEPSRYRLSAEALLRRLAKGKEIYRINNVVDLLNSISLRYGFSIGGYDDDKIQGPISLSIGKEEPYAAIGRGMLNIHRMPTLRDEVSAFGTPTSDSSRTMIQNTTTRFLMILYSFNPQEPLAEAMEESIQLLSEFAEATNIETQILG